MDFVSELICPHPEDISDAYKVTKATTKYTSGSEVTYICLSDKRFSNGQSNKTIKCGTDEHWTNIIDNCTGETCFSHLYIYRCKVSCVDLFIIGADHTWHTQPMGYLLGTYSTNIVTTQIRTHNINVLIL